MSIVAMAAMPRHVWVLSIAQALSMTAINVNIINTGLVGSAIAPALWMATLPLSSQFVAAMMTTLPASLLMGRFGRRPVFAAGVILALIATALQGKAVLDGSFALFFIGSFLLGGAQGIAQFYRYAAADNLSPELKPQAVSMVLLGGLAAAVMGPEISIRTGLLIETAPYAGCYFAIAALQLIAMIVIWLLDVPPPERSGFHGRRVTEIFALPKFVLGLISASLGYAVMVFVMTATPLQVVNISLLGDAQNARIIQWHVIAMFAPSFFTGGLIRKWGYKPIIISGVFFYLMCIAVGLIGFGFIHYFISLIFLGLGWNFLFVSGSSLIADVATPSERGRVQGVADFLLTFFIAVASFSAGALHSVIGWHNLLLGSLIPVAVISATVLVLPLSSEAKSK
jgi:MFS family permease